MKGKITVIGLGPGDENIITNEVKTAISNATNVIGYSTYLSRIKKQKGLNFYPSDNKQEFKRAEMAFELALNNKNVLVVSSGDPGIFAMATVIFEAMDNGPQKWKDIEVEILPGISSMLAASAKIGAPLGHDFCVINLSNNLKPWRIIEKRVRAAIDCDLVMAIYNPRSKSRPNCFLNLLNILKETCEGKRLIIFARAVTTIKEKIEIVELKDTHPEMADMQTIVIIGSSQSKLVSNKDRKFCYTPRSLL